MKNNSFAEIENYIVISGLSDDNSFLILLKNKNVKIRIKLS